MQLAPPSVVASWPTPNYIDPETRGPTLLIVETVLLIITTLVVAARVYVRAVLIRNFSWDDWLILVALVPTIGLTVVVCLAAERYSWDVHIWDLPASHMGLTRKISLAGQFLFIFASVATKLSILLCVLRIAFTQTFRRAIYVTMFFVTLYVPIFMAILIFQCHPMSGYWDVYNAKKSCIREGPPLIASVVCSLFFDITVYILPMPVLWRVQIPLRQRIALIGVFALGSLVVIAGAMRLYWVHIVVDETWDLTWEGFEVWMWTAIEIDLGVICASLPTLKPLIKKLLEGRAKSKAKSGFDYVDKGSVNVETVGSGAGDSKLPIVEEIALDRVTESPLSQRIWFDNSTLHSVSAAR